MLPALAAIALTSYIRAQVGPILFKVEINQERREAEVAQIEASNFFQALKSQVAEMRCSMKDG